MITGPGTGLPLTDQTVTAAQFPISSHGLRTKHTDLLKKKHHSESKEWRLPQAVDFRMPGSPSSHPVTFQGESRGVFSVRKGKLP